MKPYEKCLVLPIDKIERLVARISTDAVEYQKITGRKLSITGEIGELLATTKIPDLRLCVDSIEKGHDAIDRRGARVQIKTRRSATLAAPKSSGRIGTFSRHVFDYALLVILSDKYRVLEIWKAKYTSVEKVVQKHKRRNPTIQEFRKIAVRVYASS